ncbi:MAG TPA: hypothetical protein VF981_18155 [Gemmatimonadaceae bacterium]
MSALRTSSIALILLAGMSAPALAQGETCPVDLGKPGQVKDANKAVETSELIGKPEDKRKAFTRAVTLLTKDPQKVASNPMGVTMVLGRALIDFTTLPDMPAAVRRGDVGFTAEPDGLIDLLVTADSLLDIVEAEHPACKEETQMFRRGPYSDLVNIAVNQYNAQQLDSAEAAVRRAILIFDEHPISFYGHNILGNILQTHGDMPGAIASFRRAAEVSRSAAAAPRDAMDSSLVEDHKTATMLVAQMMIDQGDVVEGAAKTQMMSDVVTWLEDYLKAFPGDMKAQSAIATAQLKSGDVDAASRLFGAMLENPDKYTDLNLLEAGVGAARASQNAMAGQLFEAGLKKNPYSRDGLFNLATVYSDTSIGKIDQMPPILDRLTAVDPENPDNAQLAALYWQAKARELRPAAEGKDLPDPAALAFKTANDSLLYFYEKYTTAPVKVSFNLFTHDEGRHVLAGQVDNRTEEEKSYTLKFEFLDESGTVLESRDVAVEGVRGGGNKAFRVEITDKPGVTAFRYAPFMP